MSDDALASQTDTPTIHIDTNLKTGLEQFRRDPASRNELLSGYAAALAGVTGRAAVPVRITEGDHDILYRDGLIQLGTGYVKRVEEWGVEKAEAAVFGTIARMTSKKTGSATFTDSRKAAYLGLKTVLPDTKTGNVISEAGANSIASLASTLENLHRISDEFPGLRGAVAASFIANAQVKEPAPMFSSEKDEERWRAAWSTMVMEMMTPDAVSDEMYPSEEVREAVRGAARELSECVDEFGKVDYDKIKAAAQGLEAVFHREDREDDDSGGEGDGEGKSEGEGEGGGQPGGDSGEGDAPDPSKLDASLGSDKDYIAMPTSAEGDRATGRGAERVLDTNITVKKNVSGKQITASPLTERLRQWLLDVRLDQYPGQQAGRVTAQVHRLMTDGRIFGKRMRVPEAPDACVVICVDGSGSMGYGRPGDNLWLAKQLHDALCYSMDQLDIEYASCVYAGNDASEEEVHPVNLPGDGFPKSVSDSHGWRGGNGDKAAMLWAADVIEQSRKGMGCVVFLADGQFTTTNSAEFRKKAEELSISTFHVDFINSRTSPFGGGHIHAQGKRIEDIAEPLARGLALALGLE